MLFLGGFVQQDRKGHHLTCQKYYFLKKVVVAGNKRTNCNFFFFFTCSINMVKKIFILSLKCDICSILVSKI